MSRRTHWPEDPVVSEVRGLRGARRQAGGTVAGLLRLLESERRATCKRGPGAIRKPQLPYGVTTPPRARPAASWRLAR